MIVQKMENLCEGSTKEQAPLVYLITSARQENMENMPCTRPQVFRQIQTPREGDRSYFPQRTQDLFKGENYRQGPGLLMQQMKA